MSRGPRFDIAPFALPGCAPGETRFEEARDIVAVEAAFRGPVPAGIGLSYMQRTWPRVRLELLPDLERPGYFGWSAVDDQFNCAWRQGAISTKRAGRAATLAFRGLSAEFGKEVAGYDVGFRRTLGFRLDGADPASIARVRVFTASEPAETRLRVELDAGKKTPRGPVRISGYNAVVGAVPGRPGRVFEVEIRHMNPDSRYCHDEGHLTLAFGGEEFTVGLVDMERRGPAWSAEHGVFISPASWEGGFAAYRARNRGTRTVLAEVKSRPEHTYDHARGGQPRAHPVNYNLGCKHARQRFWLEPNGDLVLHRRNVVGVIQRKDRPPAFEGRDTDRFLCRGNARLFFGLETWTCTGRRPDPPPVPVYTIEMRKDGMELRQESLCVPVMRSIRAGEPAGDEDTAALMRFTFRNAGDSPRQAGLRVRYSQDSWRYGESLDPYGVPAAGMDGLRLAVGRAWSRFEGREVLRFAFTGTMKAAAAGGGAVFARLLAPGATCEVILQVPYVAPAPDGGAAALQRLDFGRCRREVAAFWRAEVAKGARLECPEPPFGELHDSHLVHVQVTDIAMPRDPALVNTSVGSSTYGNYSNEACMIVQELDQRGLHEEAAKRLAVWVRYQGTVPQPGNFTDHRGMYFGAGGFECGDYNQHHGWVLWCLAQHYLLTRDRRWLAGVAESMVQGADWVFRQRRNTMPGLPHSRGWERGFLPAGSLEDVTDFHYWLSTNSLTWRGCDAAAEVLGTIGHPEAARLRREAEAYRDDLKRGFDGMRRRAPLVRLKDGRWVPTYPSRLYVRGRDTGWIREVLEGSVYLLISGLYGSRSREADWILEDYQDNRYHEPPYGYRLVDHGLNLFNRGGFSIQPNLLAGLMPHLDRDEPEVYIWMFMNAWASCYREEINAMCEHPLPELGFSNNAQFKTSDEANAVMWLRYMYVYGTRDLLHLGRALPRVWLADGREPAVTGVATRFGRVDARWTSRSAQGAIRLVANLDLELAPPRLLARFRHPEGKRMKYAVVNGSRRRPADPVRGDVDLTGSRGRVVVEARY
ncbi:MAG: hypothetical protein AAB152_09040 [Candidatus Coatesbacteria bacterium]